MAVADHIHPALRPNPTLTKEQIICTNLKPSKPNKYLIIKRV
jgi:hypothetical protein